MRLLTCMLEFKYTHIYQAFPDGWERDGKVNINGTTLSRADDMIIYKGENFYPIQVEKVVRSFAELSDEYRIRLTTHESSGADICTVVAECIDEKTNTADFKDKIKRFLREELVVTPEIELVKFGTLERTEFKAKRIEDKRKK